MGIKAMLVCEYGIMTAGLRWMLEKEGDMEVVAEESHHSISVELVRETAPDILIVHDIGHRLNGGRVINEILSELPKVKVIVIGVDSDQESIIAMLGYGVSGYLLEDCTEGELWPAIRVILRNEIYLTPRVASVVVEKYRRKLVRTDFRKVSNLLSREHDVISPL
jgi:DNA-binding NarL/FixJ family response regulator